MPLNDNNPIARPIRVGMVDDNGGVKTPFVRVIVLDEFLDISTVIDLSVSGTLYTPTGTVSQGSGDLIIGGTDGTIIGNYNDALNVADVPSSGEDTVISVSTVVEAKVGANRKVGRGYVTLYADDANLFWGYNTSCNFPIGRDTLLFIPADDSMPIYIKSDTGTKNMVVGES